MASGMCLLMCSTVPFERTQLRGVADEMACRGPTIRSTAFMFVMHVCSLASTMLVLIHGLARKRAHCTAHTIYEQTKLPHCAVA